MMLQTKESLERIAKDNEKMTVLASLVLSADESGDVTSERFLTLFDQCVRLSKDIIRNEK